MATSITAARQALTVLVYIGFAWSNNGERIVGGRYSRGLDIATEHVIDERTLAGRMVAQKKHERKCGCFVAVAL